MLKQIRVCVHFVQESVLFQGKVRKENRHAYLLVWRCGDVHIFVQHGERVWDMNAFCYLVFIFCRTKIFLEHSGCRTWQPGRTWLLGPGTVLVLIQNNTYFWTNGTNQTKGCYRGRKPITKKILVRPQRRNWKYNPEGLLCMSVCACVCVYARVWATCSH